MAVGGGALRNRLHRGRGDIAAMDAYEAFDRREPGWTKVTLELSG
jgi:hypothetical protein